MEALPKRGVKFVQVAVEGLESTGVAGFEPATNGLEVRYSIH